MSRSFHMRADLRGILRRAVNVQHFEGMFKHRTEARPMTAEEAFDAIVDQLKMGRECIPLSECDNFDFKSGGCQGHPVEPKLTVVGGTDIEAVQP